MSSPPTAAPKESPSLGRRVVPILAVLLILAIGAFAVWKLFFSKPKLPDNVIALSGRIEGDDSAVSPRTSGRILEIRCRDEPMNSYR